MYEYIKEHLEWLPFVLVAFLVFCWTMFGGKNNDGRGTVSEVEQQLKHIGLQQQTIIREVKSSRDSIAESRQQLSEVSAYSRSNAELIAESKQIVREIERRTKERTGQK